MDIHYIRFLKLNEIDKFLKFKNLQFLQNPSEFKNLKINHPKYVVVYSKHNSNQPQLIENYITAINKDGYIELNIHKKIYLEKMLYSILNKIVNDFPIDYVIKCNINITSNEFSEIIDIISKYSFDSPGINQNAKIVVLSKTNIPPCKNHSNYIIIKKTIYMIENFIRNIEKSNYCGVKIILSKNCIDVLKSLSHKSFYQKEKEQVQYEFTGHLDIESVKNENNNLLITLNINENNITSGGEDNVDGVDKPFTFHTHPKKTYDIQKVIYAWPSIEDLETVYNLITKSSGVMHLIAALEGVYIISIDKEWKNIDKTNDGDLFYHYQIPYPEKNEKTPLTPDEYIYKLNKNKNLPLEVQYFSWNNLENLINIYVEKTIENNLIYCKLDLS